MRPPPPSVTTDPALGGPLWVSPPARGSSDRRRHRRARRADRTARATARRARVPTRSRWIASTRSASGRSPSRPRARRPARRCAVPLCSTRRGRRSARPRQITGTHRRRSPAGDLGLHGGGGRAAGGGAATRERARHPVGPDDPGRAHRRAARSAAGARGGCRPRRPASRRTSEVVPPPSRGDHRSGVRRRGPHHGDERRTMLRARRPASRRASRSSSRPRTDSPGSKPARRSRSSRDGRSAYSAKRRYRSSGSPPSTRRARRAARSSGCRGCRRATRCASSATTSPASRLASSSTSGRPRPSRRSPTDEPWDLTSNVTGVAGLDAGSLRATELAMHDAGIRPDDEVQFVGFSQGGLVAARLAASGEWNADRARDLRRSDGCDRAARRPRRHGRPQHRRLRPGPRRTRSSTTTCCRSSGAAFAEGSPIPTDRARSRAPTGGLRRDGDRGRRGASSAAVREQIAAMDAFTSDYAERDGSSITVTTYHAERGGCERRSRLLRSSGGSIP